MKMQEKWARLSDLCSEISKRGGEEIAEILADAYEMFENETEENLDGICWSFVRRVQARVEFGNELPKRNTVTRATLGDGEYYCITNYDYPTFKWAIKCGFGPWVDCCRLYVPKSKLSKAAAEAMDNKITKK